MALSTCWSMTINNPSEEMMVLVRNPNQDYIRQLIWTAEEGEEGTPHIQAYLRLIKQQRMSFVKKLFPSGHFQPCSAAEYTRNCIDYAQKEDDTTVGAHVNTLADTIADPVYLLNRLIRTILDRELAPWQMEQDDADSLLSRLQGIPVLEAPTNWVGRLKLMIQREEGVLARSRPSVCKLLVSAQYTKIKDNYLLDILKYNIDKYIQTRDANDNEGQGTGETTDDETESTTSTSEETEEDFEEEGDESSSQQSSDERCAEDIE